MWVETMLEMRDSCERCSVSLGNTDSVLICSYECTFCVDCGRQMAQRCPNCNGELVPRPKRE